MSRPTQAGVTGWIRRALTENIGLKLMAVAASLVLFVMRGSEEDTGIVSVRLVAPERDGFLLVSDVPEQVHITFTGSRSIVNSVRQEPPEAIRIPHDTEARFFYIEASQLDLPPGVSVSSIEPTAIRLDWAPLRQQRFDVDPVIEGAVAEGLVRASTTVEPPAVQVRGAASQLAELARIHTRPVDIAGLGIGVHELSVPLMPLPRHVAYVGSGSVTVTVTVESEEGRRRIEDVDVVVVGGMGFELRPAQVDVLLVGPRSSVEELHARRVIPFVDVGAFDPTLGAQQVRVELQPLPEELTVTVEPTEILVSGAVQE